MEVRATCRWVAGHASHVSIDIEGIEKLVNKVDGNIPEVEWDFEGIHFFDNGPLTAQYMLVLDALNFCFWPDKDLKYEHLATGLKRALLEDRTMFDAERLQTYTGPQLRTLMQWSRKLPLEDERARVVRELGSVLQRHFGGLASNLVASSNGSAVALVELVASHFPGFRDHSIYKSHQVFFYKRAQIFVADLWGAFHGKGLGKFRDIGSITMFADYVVPAVLRNAGILQYSSSLAYAVDHEEELAPGSEEELEIRACTITAVEQLRETLVKRNGKQVTSVQLDWWLWSSGSEPSNSPVGPMSFHRTRTIYY